MHRKYKPNMSCNKSSFLHVSTVAALQIHAPRFDPELDWEVGGKPRTHLLSVHVLPVSKWIFSRFSSNLLKTSQLDRVLQITPRWEWVCEWCPEMCLNQGVFLPHAQYSWDIHRNPVHDEMITEEECTIY